MSLENVIQENTRAVNALAELLKQAMGMMPPTGTAPVAPTAPQPAPKPVPEPVAAPAPVVKADAAPVAPEPSQPAPQEPSVPANCEAFRKALMPRVRDLFMRSQGIGTRILRSFDAVNVSSVPDDKLVAFAKAVDEALAKAIGEALSRA